MKNIAALALLSALVLGAVSRPALAATTKADAQAASIAAALQAVSPDSLGGRLGATIASARASDYAPSTRAVAATQTSLDADRQAYSAWKKSSRKS